MTRKKAIICGCFVLIVFVVIAGLFYPRKLVSGNAKFEIMSVAIKNDKGQEVLIDDKMSAQDKEKLGHILRSYSCTLCPDPKRYDDSFEDIQYLIHTSYGTDTWWYLMIYEDKIYRQGGNYYYVVKDSGKLKTELYELLKPYVE